MKLRSKDILGLEYLEPDEMSLILDMASDMKKIAQSNMKRVNYLQPERDDSVLRKQYPDTGFFEPAANIWEPTL